MFNVEQKRHSQKDFCPIWKSFNELFCRGSWSRWINEEMAVASLIGWEFRHRCRGWLTIGQSEGSDCRLTWARCGRSSSKRFVVLTTYLPNHSCVAEDCVAINVVTGDLGLNLLSITFVPSNGQELKRFIDVFKRKDIQITIGFCYTRKY